MKRKGLIRILKKIVVLFIVALIVLTFARTVTLSWMGSSEDESNVPYGTSIQGNHLLLETDSCLVVFDMETGKRKALRWDPRPLWGYTEATVLDDKLFWFSAWDGGKQGKIHGTCKNPFKIVSLPKDFIYSDCYVLLSDRMYYFDEKNKQICEHSYNGVVRTADCNGRISYLTYDDDKILFYQKKAGKIYQMNADSFSLEKSIAFPYNIMYLQGFGEDRYLIQTYKNGLFLWDSKSGDIKPYIDNKVIARSPFFWSPDSSRITFTMKGKDLYYLSGDFTIHKFVENGTDRIILDPKKQSFLKDCYEKNGSVTIAWGRDYFAIIAGLYDLESDQYNSRIDVYNYDGQHVHKIKDYDVSLWDRIVEFAG